MKIQYLVFLLLALMISGCAPRVVQTPSLKPDVYLNGTYTKPEAPVLTDTVTLLDSSRNRLIPIAIYYAANSAARNSKKKLVILNPGYGGKNTDYGYIANSLAENGYFVVTIQHDLVSDDTLPKTGDIYKLRKPFWDRGVRSIFFVTDKIRKQYPELDYNHIILIGHSNGGDIAMLMASEYPGFAKIIISLDNRRVPFPRYNYPKIFSIRSSDQTADPDVLPSPEEQKKYKIEIVKVNTRHNDMGGMGTNMQKWEITHYILQFLNKNR